MGYSDDILNQSKTMAQGMGYTQGGVLKALADRANQLGATERMFMEEMKFKKDMMNKQYKVKEKEAERANMMSLLGLVANLVNPSSGTGEKLWGKTTKPSMTDYYKLGSMDIPDRQAAINAGALEPKSEPGLLTQPWGEGGNLDWLKWLLGAGAAVGGVGAYNELSKPVDYGDNL